MRTITMFIVIAAVALGLIGCGAPANNAPANTSNANTAKPAPAAPTADALLALDKAANEAYFKGDSAYFETFLSDKFGWAEKAGHKTKADVLKEIAGGKCDMKSFDLSDPQMSKIDDDTYAFSYKGTFDGTCTENGKSSKVPSPVRAATVFVRNGDKWQAVWHGEQAAMEPKKDEKADTAKLTDAKKDDKAETAKPAEVTKPLPGKQQETAKKEEPKKEETAKKEEPKKEENKPIGATKTAPANATGAAPAAPAAADANTDALVKVELAGWTAWKDHNAKGVEDGLAKTLAIVGPGGRWIGTRAEVVKLWTETDATDCKDVKNVAVKDGFAWALSPTVEILTFTGSADGTCGGMKNGTYHGTSVYVKEGDAWKLAFNFLEPETKS